MAQMSPARGRQMHLRSAEALIIRRRDSSASSRRPRSKSGPKRFGEHKRVVSCKDSFHGADVLAVSEHGAPGRRPNIHAHFIGRQREDGLDTLPARAAEANRSTLI